MPQIISIHSFRGGTGKSNTTANLAAQFAAGGKRVCVIDTDIQSPGIHILFGLNGEEVTSSLNDFLWNGFLIEDVAIDVTPKLVKEKSGQIYLVPSSIKPGEISRVMREGYDTLPDLAYSDWGEPYQSWRAAFVSHPGTRPPSFARTAPGSPRPSDCDMGCPFPAQ